MTTTTTGRIHAATLDSPRLTRFLAALADGKKHSTLTVQRKARVCNAHSCAAECRARGVNVTVEREGELYYYSRTAAKGE